VLPISEFQDICIHVLIGVAKLAQAFSHVTIILVIDDFGSIKLGIGYEPEMLLCRICGTSGLRHQRASSGTKL
jgi:hypothetical protein